MLRLSLENGINFLALWNMVKKIRHHFVQSDDIGILNFAPVNMIDSLHISILSSIEFEDILRMTFYYLLKKLCGNSSVERSRFISNILRDTYCYCPMCLEEMQYHKLLWLIKDINMCDKHKISLLKQCSMCNQQIKLKNLKRFDICPYCGHSLLDSKVVDKLNEKEIDQQEWLYNTYNNLISITDNWIEPTELAIKILFILNNSIPIFNKEVVQITLKDRKILPTLLQHVRGSLSNKRTLHLSFILSILYQRNISIEEFLKLEIPNSFITSVKNKTNSKKSEVSCIAPWCTNYMKKGLLVKTGTTFKRKKDGTVNKYYLRCPECGCEYAIDENNELKERTYFIQGYTLLCNLSKQELGLRKLSEKTGLSEEMVRRCLAYFLSRGIFVGEFSRKPLIINELLQLKFSNALKSGTSINEIKKWPVWESYNHFLLYRYHKDIIKSEANIHKNSEYKKYNENTESRRSLIKITLENMLQQGKLITIKNTCKEISVCPETLRLWGCNSLISQMKARQREESLIELKNKLRNMVDKYLIDNRNKIITSDGLYSYIGIKRTILWRIYPELTTHIGHFLKDHNKRMNKNSNINLIK